MAIPEVQMDEVHLGSKVQAFIGKTTKTMSAPFSFPDTTLLITHYNRSASLERLLASFRALDCNFSEVLVSDDGSKPEQLEKLRSLQPVYSFRLVTSPKN